MLNLFLFRLEKLKVLLIVRDPRSVMHARLASKWCLESEICRDESFLCRDMSEDFDQISRLQKDFPNRIGFLRYEDFYHLPLRHLLEFSQFLGTVFSWLRYLAHGG